MVRRVYSRAEIISWQEGGGFSIETEAKLHHDFFLAWLHGQDLLGLFPHCLKMAMGGKGCFLHLRQTVTINTPAFMGRQIREQFTM